MFITFITNNQTLHLFEIPRFLHQNGRSAENAEMAALQGSMKSTRRFACMWPDENGVSKWQLSRRNMSNVEFPRPRIEHSKSQRKSRDKKKYM